MALSMLLIHVPCVVSRFLQVTLIRGPIHRRSEVKARKPSTRTSHLGVSHRDSPVTLPRRAIAENLHGFEHLLSRLRPLATANQRGALKLCRMSEVVRQAVPQPFTPRTTRSIVMRTGRSISSLTPTRIHRHHHDLLRELKIANDRTRPPGHSDRRASDLLPHLRPMAHSVLQNRQDKARQCPNQLLQPRTLPVRAPLGTTVLWT